MPSLNQIYFYNQEPLTDINPLFLGEENCAPDHSFGPRICPYTIIHYVMSGSGTVESEGRVYSVSAGQIFVIFSGDIATYKADSLSPWNYMWVSFDGLYMNKLRSLGTNVFDAPSEVFNALLCELRKNSCDKYFAASQLYSLYSHLLPSFGEKVVTSYPDEVKEIIKLRYMESLSIADIAKSLNIDQRYMSRIFKKKYGKTVIGYLIEIRMKKACELLKAGYSVADTAAIIGYADSFNFSKMFKKTIGTAPSEYKKTVII